MTKLSFVILLILSVAQLSIAQIASNLLQKSATQDSFSLGIDLYSAYQNGAVSHYENYEDPLHYLVSPFLHYKFNSRVTFDFRVNIENIRDDYVYPQRVYYGDEFAKHRGGIEIGKIEYQNDWFELRFGRDYFIPGKRYYEGLLFSEYGYSYDQIWLALKKGPLKIASYYLDLNVRYTQLDLAQRYLNGHRFSWQFGQGYFAFNDVIVYGGVNRQLKPALFNPFLLFYPYQKNRRNFESNSLMSIEIYFPWRDYFLFAEFLIDDFQVDKEAPGDLEPTEWGMNLTVGKNNLLDNLHWKANYTRVANRTFNAPIQDYEKYLYKLYPIGHFLGNNFWELKSTLTYDPTDDWSTALQASYLETGEEALYGPFNTDFMNYTVEQGYVESFPFGPIQKQSGLIWSAEYKGIPDLHISTQAAYWLTNDLLDNDFSFRLALQYRFRIYSF